MDSLGAMMSIADIVALWNKDEITSEEALKQIEAILADVVQG